MNETRKFKDLSVKEALASWESSLGITLKVFLQMLGYQGNPRYEDVTDTLNDGPDVKEIATKMGDDYFVVVIFRIKDPFAPVYFWIRTKEEGGRTVATQYQHNTAYCVDRNKIVAPSLRRIFYDDGEVIEVRYYYSSIIYSKDFVGYSEDKKTGLDVRLSCKGDSAGYINHDFEERFRNLTIDDIPLFYFDFPEDELLDPFNDWEITLANTDLRSGLITYLFRRHWRNGSFSTGIEWVGDFKDGKLIPEVPFI